MFLAAKLQLPGKATFEIQARPPLAHAPRAGRERERRRGARQAGGARRNQAGAGAPPPRTSSRVASFPPCSACPGQSLYASIGWSLPASLGYALGAGPGRRVVCIIGDGALQMTVQVGSLGGLAASAGGAFARVAQALERRARDGQGRCESRGQPGAAPCRVRQARPAASPAAGAVHRAAPRHQPDHHCVQQWELYHRVGDTRRVRRSSRSHPRGRGSPRAQPRASPAGVQPAQCRALGSATPPPSSMPSSTSQLARNPHSPYNELKSWDYCQVAQGMDAGAGQLRTFKVLANMGPTLVLGLCGATRLGVPVPGRWQLLQAHRRAPRIHTTAGCPCTHPTHGTLGGHRGGVRGGAAGGGGAAGQGGTDRVPAGPRRLLGWVGASMGFRLGGWRSSAGAGCRPPRPTLLPPAGVRAVLLARARGARTEGRSRAPACSPRPPQWRC